MDQPLRYDQQHVEIRIKLQTNKSFYFYGGNNYETWRIKNVSVLFQHKVLKSRKILAILILFHYLSLMSSTFNMAKSTDH